MRAAGVRAGEWVCIYSFASLLYHGSSSLSLSLLPPTSPRPAHSSPQDLLGNLFGAATVFGWPAFFYLRGRGLRRLPISRFDKLMCGTYLLVCMPLFTGLGTVNSILKIVDDWGALGKPFECKLHSR